MSADPLIEAANLTRTYDGVPVLDAVSLSIGSGVTAVVGPNGSGKSTLLGALAGEVEPVEGDIRYVGPDAPRPIGYLPQQVPFREGFTARETLAFYARLVDDDPDRALERVGLADASDRLVEELSGGMLRLLGIAQATIGDPPLVVLDEPTSGLDPGMRERAFAAATEGVDDETGVVVSSHDLTLVDEHADGIVVLDRGTVAAAGGRSALYDEHGVDDATELYRAVLREQDDENAEDDTVYVTGVSER